VEHGVFRAVGLELALDQLNRVDAGLAQRFVFVLFQFGQQRLGVVIEHLWIMPARLAVSV